MVDAKDLRKLKDQFEAALSKDKLKEAAELCARVERLEPGNARWPHRLGDLLRRLNNTPQAIAAYERAVDCYVNNGFLPRAVAMAKTITSLDPARGDVMARLGQGGAQKLTKKARSSLVAPQPAQRDHVETAPTLTLALDRAADEVRFVDAGPDQELEMGLELTEAELGFIHLDEPVLEPTESAELAASRLALLPSFALFADVPRAALLEIAEASSLVQLEREEVVVRTGDAADALYLVVEGSARVSIPGLGVEARQSLREGDVFGEACLLTDEPRHADVVVEQTLTALRIPKDTLDVLVQRHVEVGRVLMSLLTRRLLVNLVKTSPLFAALDLQTRREVVNLFEIRKAHSGTLLTEARKRGDGLYIPLTGKLEATARDGSVRLLPAGTLVGQASLLSQAPFEHTVRTLGDTVMLRLPAARFLELVTQFPTVLEQLANISLDDTLGVS